jgi:hypothetical protein
MPVLMVVRMMVLSPVGMLVLMIMEVLMFVRVGVVIVTMVMGTMGMIMPASCQQRTDAAPEHRSPQTYHNRPRCRT